MSAFVQACRVEDRSWDLLEPYLKARSFDGRFVRTSKGPLSLELQKSVGDALVNTDRQTVYGIEVKAEERHTGNLFLERWSNRSRFTPGWFETLSTDLLWCHFLDQDVVYEMAFGRLRQWLYWHTGRGHPKCHTFELAKQGKYEQLNDTWGYLVPLRELRDSNLIRREFHPEFELHQQELPV